MMLPGAVPAVVRRAHASGQVRAVPLFMGSYLAVWTLVGLAVYALYRPHGSVAAGVVAIAAGVYELTALKQQCRQRCRDSVGSGLEFGLYCVGSSIGLMLILVALSVMSIASPCSSPRSHWPAGWPCWPIPRPGFTHPAGFCAWVVIAGAGIYATTGARDLTIYGSAGLTIG